MTVASVRNTKAATGKRRGRGVPFHSSVNVRMAFVFSMAVQDKFIGPIQAPAAIARGGGKSFKVCLRDLRGAMIGNGYRLLARTNARIIHLRSYGPLRLIGGQRRNKQGRVDARCGRSTLILGPAPLVMVMRHEILLPGATSHSCVFFVAAVGGSPPVCIEA